MITNSQRERILEELYSFHRAGIQPGLHRTHLLLAELGNPEAKMKCIHVAGTNGKGSVCSMLASLFSEAGYKTGLYTSPHIMKFNERIKINGEDISCEDLTEILEKILPIAKKLACTFFEITTAVAFEYFKRKNTDIAIIETGMGGRFDSTNVIYPLLSIVTQIDLDHQEYLGDTLEKIAGEKAGIFKPAVPVIIADNHKELKELFTKRAEDTESPLVFTSEMFEAKNMEITDNLTMKLEYSDMAGQTNKIEIEKAGKHQVANFFAVAAAFNFLRKTWNLSDENFRNAMRCFASKWSLKGRIELISKNPLVILDVSHNPAGIAALVDTLENSPYRDVKFNIVFGVMADKDVKHILQTLMPFVAKLVITHPNIERADSLEHLQKLAFELGYKDVELIADVKTATKQTSDLGAPTLVVGSFYTAGEASPAL